jgi:hypothetical protein
MLFSSNRARAHGGVAYHWNGGAAQEILEINRSKLVRYGCSSRGEGGAGRWAAAGPEQPESYLLEYEYGEDCSGPRRKQTPGHYSPQ